MEFIRFERPDDILVIPNSEKSVFYDLFENSKPENNCGHPHMIVFSDGMRFMSRDDAVEILKEIEGRSFLRRLGRNEQETTQEAGKKDQRPT